MSVNLSRELLDRRCAEFHVAGPVRDTLVFYGGYREELHPGNEDMGKWENGKYRSCARAWDAVKELFHPSNRKSLNPDLDKRRLARDNRAARAGDEFLALSEGPPLFDPRGKLIIYGYSTGGFNAMDLCRRIIAYRPWYDFRRNRLGGAPANPSNPDFARVQVDLLITVDACRKLASPSTAALLTDAAMAAGANTNTPNREFVLDHVNYFEDKDPEFRGVRIADALNLSCEPHDRANAHKDMPVITVDEVKRRLREVLTRR